MKTKKILTILSIMSITLTTSYSNLEATSVNAKTTYSIRNDNLAYELDKNIDKTINTFAAYIKLPSNLSSDNPCGIILGNYMYNNMHPGACDFTVDNNGHFKVFWDGSKNVYTFTKTDLRNDVWTHVALVRDYENNKLSLYIDGFLDETINVVLPEAVCYTSYRVGVDQASWYWNLYGQMDSPFLGEIKQVSLFSEPLNRNEIESIIGNTKITKDDYPSVITNLNFKSWGNEQTISDSSNQINAHLVSFNKEVPVKEVSDYDYSFIVVPDMQAMTYWQPTNFELQSQWIIDNKEELNIQFVMYVGDMTESKFVNDPDSSTEEWELASSCIKQLDDVVPYSVVLGNHDYDNWAQASRATTQFNKFFKYEDYCDRDYFGGAFIEGCMDNTYIKFNVGEISYLIFSLEEGPRSKVLNWVDRIIDENPNSRVLITTHAYLTAQNIRGAVDTTISPPSKTITYSDVNDADKMWEKCFSKHPNIMGVFGGHECSDDILYNKDTGLYGNKVHQILVDLQGSMMTNRMNTVLLVKVNERNKTWDLCYYWIEKDSCFNIQNQFQISIEDKFNPTIGEK